MPAPTIAETLKYANLQMAAEALYRFNATPPGTVLTPGDKFVGDIPSNVLTTGNLPEDFQGSDWIDGGDGADRIWGMAGDDIIIGGKGADYIVGGKGRDTYIFNKGDGVDEIWDDDSGPDKSIMVFGEGFDKDSIKLRPGSLLLDMGDGDAIHIENFDRANRLATQSFSSFQFADGSSLTWKSRRWRYGGIRLQMHEQSSERRAA